MRLNRVLLLAAIISVMMFALVFTISCSGDDGKNGKNGNSCKIAEQDGINWTVYCDDGTEIVLHGGDGPNGADGKDGPDGENCWLNKSGNGYEVRCGAGAGQVKGSLDGCAIYPDDSNPYLVVLACGKYEANICNNEIFDALRYTCSDGGIVEESNATFYEYCPGLEYSVKSTRYDTRKQYCGFGSTDKEVYDHAATLYEWCGDKNLDQPNQSEFNVESYCRYFDKDRKNARLAGSEVGDYCNGKAINKDSWKTEYCGYATLETKVKSLISGACDSADVNGVRGPNELSFGQGYCEVKFRNAFLLEDPSTGRKYTDPLRENPKTTYSENLCGTSANNKPNNGAWKDEYCGYASDASVENDIRTKIYTGVCSDATEDAFKAPHYEGYNKGYCEVKFADRDSFVVRNDKVIYKTEYTEDSFCNDDPTQRPNDAEWKAEYCGYATANGNLTVLKGICDDGQGPSEDAYSPAEYCRFDRTLNATAKTDEGCDNGDKVNENEWKGEYCGYASRGVNATSKQTGICDDDKGPNSDEYAGGYCTVTPLNRKSNKTEYTDEFCGASGKVNENKWQAQYCGYANATADDADRIYSDACDDGTGKHKSGYNQEGYCYVADPETPSTFTAQWCNQEKKSGKYNEKVWKGEWCFADKIVSDCKGNLVGDVSVNHNSKFKCYLPSAEQRCKDNGAASWSYVENGTPKQVVPAYKNGLCNVVLPTNKGAGTDFVNWNVNSLSPSGNNCFALGKNKSYGYAGVISTNSNGGYVYSSCTNVITLTANVSKPVGGDPVTIKYFNEIGDQNLCVASDKRFTTGNSNCFGGPQGVEYGGTWYSNVNQCTQYAGVSSTYCKTFSAGRRTNTVNTWANLGFEWGLGTSYDQRVIDTFTKTCKWENNKCEVTVEQASPVFPKNIWGDGSHGKGQCTPAGGTTSPTTILAQECRYVP